MPRKVSRRNTKRNTKPKRKLSKNKSHKKSKKLSKKLSKKILKKPSASRVKKFTGRKLLPRRAIIFPEPIMMDGGGIDREMLGL